MIALIPAGILIISGLGLLILHQFRKGFGIPWLITVAATMIAWILTLVLHWFPPLPLYIVGWSSVEKFTNLLCFQLDLISWPYAFALSTLTLAVILTSSARLHRETGPLVWSANLIVSGFGLLTVLAATPTTLILTWTLVDISELVILQQATLQAQKMRTVIVSFSVRMIGSFSIAIAMILSRNQGTVLSFDQIIPQAGIFLFIGAVLRLGVIPRNLPYPADFPYRRELGAIIRSVEPASALVLLAHLPDAILPENWMMTIRLLVIFAALYGAGMWLVAKDEIEGRPYWLIGTAGLATIGVLNGFPTTSIVWGLILILVGGLINLYSTRDMRIQYIPLLAVLSFLGLPFTPAAGGWQGVVNQPFTLMSIGIFIIHLLLALGLIRHLFQPGEPYANLERWIQVVYPIGLLVLIISHWIIFTWGWPGSYTAGVWWASIVPGVILMSGYFIFARTTVWQQGKDWVLQNGLSIKKIAAPLEKIFSFGWLFDLGAVFYRIIQSVINLITLLLEGDGGFLWALLLLALLITLVAPGGVS